MTATEYREASGMNFSTLKHILDSPAHYQAALAEERKETPAMLFGTLFHALALEGKDIEQMAYIRPFGMNFTSKEGKQWKEDHEDKPILTLDEYRSLRRMQHEASRNQSAKQLLASCDKRELPIFATLCGVPCKALLDACGEASGRKIICDIKTTDDASPQAFARKVANFHYDMQAAMYCDLAGLHFGWEEEPKFFWLACQKDAPWTCVVYDADDWLATGRDKYRNALSMLKHCMALDSWPQPFDGINYLIRPAWA
jgi:exodeoxyribonuclease VIII